MLQHQLSYAIKTELKATKSPVIGHFLPFPLYLCNQGDPVVGLLGALSCVLVAKLAQ